MTPSASGSHQQNGEGQVATHQAGLSPFVCACFTLNYLIGTGFLTLPWAFERAGILLSTLGMIFICVIANTGSDYILSAMARAEALSVYLRSQGIKKEEEATEVRPTEEVCPHDSFVADEETTLLPKKTYKSNHEDTESSEQTKIAPSSSRPKLAAKFSMEVNGHESFASFDEHTESEGRLLVGDHKFELTQLCQIFLGDTGLKAYGVAVALDIYGFLWAYTSVFGAAMAHSFPLFGPDFDCYHIYVFLFSLIVVPMSFLELSEQATVQVMLSACRIVMILLMVLTPLAAALFGSGGDVEEGVPPIPHFDDQTAPEGASFVNFANIHEMIPILVFAVLFHQAVPGLADEMTEKSKVGTIFGLTFVLCTVAYSLIGSIVAWYFGELVYESSNINWNDYHAGTGQRIQNEDGESQWVGVAWWAQMISIFVVCFPAIDVVSAFPLNAFVLGNSLVGLAYADRIHEVQHNRRINNIYRAIAAIPPIIGALFVRDLGIITDYSGLTGLAIAFCFPALLYIASEDKAKELGIPYRTRYQRIGSTRTSAKAMFWFGVVTIIFCFILLVAEG